MNYMGKTLISKNTVFYLLKIVLAGCAAFLLLNIMCLFYYNLPVHASVSTGATDYAWLPGRFYSVATEGYSFGKMDKNGYNNSFSDDYSQPDILIMGSSYMEATQVAQNKNTTYLMNSLFKKEGTNLSAYNIGVSAHYFLRCSRNLENALKTFSPKKYVVIETNNIKFDAGEIGQVLDGSYGSIDSKSKGFVGKLQMIPFFRLLYYQIDGIKNANKVSANPSGSGVNTDSLEQYTARLNKLLSRLAGTAGENKCRLIILYQPAIKLNADGSAYAVTDEEYYKVFSSACEANNIAFVDMTDTFLTAYGEQHILPCGFANTKVGAGHLNENGHKMIAGKLHDVITELENRRLEVINQ